MKKNTITLIGNVSLFTVINFLILCWKRRIRTDAVTLYHFNWNRSRPEKNKRKIFSNDQLFRNLLDRLVLKSENLEFRPIKLVNRDGRNLGLSMLFLDHAQINLRMWEKVYGVAKAPQDKSSDRWLGGYFSKSLFNVTGQPGTVTNHKDSENIRHCLLCVNAISKIMGDAIETREVVCLMKVIPFLEIVRDYSRTRNIELIEYRDYLADLYNSVLFSLGIDWLSRFVKLVSRDVLYGGRRSRREVNDIARVISKDGAQSVVIDQVIGMFPVNSFWGVAKLENAKLVFSSMSHQLAQSTYNDIVEAGMYFVPMGPNVASDLSLTRYIPKVNWRGLRKHPIAGPVKRRERRLIDQCNNEYVFEKNKFINLFSDIGSKLYVSSQRWSPHQVAAASAIAELGGISALWQVSYYDFVDPTSINFSDIFFSFWKKGLEEERSCGSQIEYRVCIGYIGDYRFNAVRPPAMDLRRKLIGGGAKKIISYLDESSSEDGYWDTTHKEAQDDYRFWLEKVLVEEWLGLIIKPKKPSRLRDRLGNVNELLAEAIDTGRCIVLEADYTPPAQAALASDIVIHDTLRAGTAGLESALSGTRTLMFDRNKWRESQLYKMGKGRVVFDDWLELWDAVLDSWGTNSKSEIGDWSPFISEWDPFRDGCARDRMIAYLGWIVDGIRMGLKRERNLEYAAEQYSKVWGIDKIESNNSEPL